MISIIIPVLNPTEKFFHCLESIKAQVFQNWEVIIIDSGNFIFSEDYFPKDIIQRFRFVQEIDSGVYDAMNKGIKLSLGDWLYFMGSDDYFYDELVLFNIWNYINNQYKPVVYGNVLIRGNTGWAKDGDIYAGKFSKNRMLVKSICHQSIFYRRDFLIQNNLFFDLRYPVSADWHFNLRCRRLTKFKYVDLVIAVFSAGGISSKKKDSFPEQIRSEFQDLYPSRVEVIFKEVIKSILRIFK